MIAAVEHLHSQGLVHGDIHLENWVLTDEGKAPRLTDFGNIQEGLFEPTTLSSAYPTTQDLRVITDRWHLLRTVLGIPVGDGYAAYSDLKLNLDAPGGDPYKLQSLLLRLSQETSVRADLVAFMKGQLDVKELSKRLRQVFQTTTDQALVQKFIDAHFCLV